MKTERSLPVLGAWVICGLCASHGAANAQSYPTKPVRWVVPSAAGDGSDIMARLIGDRVARELGQPIVIENKPGAGGVVGSEAVALAAPDGYTMVIGNAGSHGINAAIYTKLRYKVVEDFAPVAMFCTTPNVMVTSPNVKANTVSEFAALAQANPGKLNYASGGVGSSAHMSTELFERVAGINLVHIPYKGALPAITGVLSDEAQIMIGNLPPWLTHIKAGRVRALAVTSLKRNDALPQVPAMAEVFPGFETIAWFGLLAPKGTPKAVVDRMNAAVNKVLGQADVKSQLAAASCEVAVVSPEAMGVRITSEVARWKTLAAENFITAD